MCDETITGQGNAEVLDVDTDQCNVYVKVAHASGCPKSLGWQKFVHKYPWVMAILFIAGGLLTGLYGEKLFESVFAGILTVAAMAVLVMVCIILGLMDTTVGMIITIVVCAALSGVVFWLAWKVMDWATAILGGIAGFMLGILSYSVYLGLFNHG